MILVMEGFLNDKSIQKYDLLNENHMREIIENNDVIVNKAAYVDRIPTPNGYMHSVYDHWMAHDGMFFDSRVLDLLLETIHRLCPEYYQAAKEYLNGKWHRGYNCYVMRKDLFFRMCEFQFSVLFDMKKSLELEKYPESYERTLGYMGEIMYGIYIYYLQQTHKYKIREEQLVYFEQTVLPSSIWQYWCDSILFWIKFHFETIGYLLLPKNSKRRNFIKNIYFKIAKR